MLLTTWRDFLKFFGSASASIASRRSRRRASQASTSTEPLEMRVLPAGNVLSIEATNPPLAGAIDVPSVTYTVTFDRDVIVDGVDASDFRVVTTGSVQFNPTLNVASIDHSTYAVTIQGLRGTGDLRLDLIDNDTILDEALQGQPGSPSQMPLGTAGLYNGSFQGDTYQLAAKQPKVVSINRIIPPDDAPYATTIRYQVRFSEPVTGVDVDDFETVLTGSIALANAIQVTGSDSQYTVTISGISGDGTIGLNLVDNRSIIDASGNGLVPSGPGLSFAEPLTIAVSGTPRSIATADMNGDGFTDVVSSTVNGFVSVALGNGDGTFQSPLSYSVAGSPGEIAVRDLNGDGVPDLVVINSSGNTFDIYLGNGDGTLQSPDSRSSGIAQSAIALNFADGDGFPDIIITSAPDGRADVISNSGNGVYLPAPSLTTGNNPSDIVFGDLNADGYLDIAIANLDDDTVSVFLSQTGDGFGSPQTYAVGDLPNGVALGDVDGDGDLDLVTSNEGDNNVSLLRGNGNGTFQPRVTYTTGSMPTAVRMIDINGDGLSDVLVSNSGDANFGVLFGLSNGNLTNQLTFEASPVPGDLAIGDLNEDGRLDVLIAETELGGVRLALNTSTASFIGQVFNRSNAAPSLNTPSEVTVPENTPASTDILIVTAVDTDTPPQSLTYSISGDDAGSFNFDPANRTLRFKVAPDYEVPVDADQDNSYQIVVTVDDGFGGVAQQPIVIIVQPLDDNPIVFTSPADISVFENTSISDALISVAAKDADTPFTLFWYSLSGDDAAHFEFNDESREIRFVSSPDFENPIDANQDNVYTFVITAVDQEGKTQTQTVTVRVLPLNDNYPNFDGPSSATVPENTPASTVVLNVDATDDDLPLQALTYSLSGDDRLLFSIDGSNGEIRFLASPDYEAPADQGEDNVYNLIVTVSDGGGGTQSQELTITITPVDDNPLLITSPSVVLVEENFDTQTLVLDVNALDADLPAKTITFSLSGPDAERFTIDTVTGEIYFLVSPDFEVPADQDQNNLYEVTVTAHEPGEITTSQNITISVLPVDDNPTLHVGPFAASVPENVPTSDVVLTFAATDADLPTGLTFGLTGDDSSLFSINNETGEIRFLVSPNFEAPGDLDQDNVYSIGVMTFDGGGAGVERAVTITVLPVNDNAPVITSSNTASFDENSATSIIVQDVNATDADLPSQTFTYSLSGIDGVLFTIGSDGEIRFRNSPDFEAPQDSNQDGAYLVRVTVTDTGDPSLSSTQDVTITVGNVDEAPVVADLALETDEETPLSIELSGSDPDAGTTLSYFIETDPLHGTLSSVDGQPGNFVYTPDPGYVGPDSFTYRASADGLDSNLGTVSITVNLGNGPPVVEDATVSIAENSPNGTLVTTVIATDEDTVDGPDSDAITFAITGGNTEGAFSIDPSNGELRVSNVAALNFEVRQQFFVQVTVTDLLGQTDVATITVNITNVNEPLIIGLPSTNFLTYRTNGAPTPIDPQASVFDEDLTRTNYNGGRLTITVSMTDRNLPADPHDRLGLPVEGSGPGKISIVSNYIVFDSPLNIIGTIVSGLDGGPLVIDLTSFSDDLTTVPALLRAITFYNTSSNPQQGARTITFDLVDGPGENSGTKSKQLNFITESADPVIVPGQVVEIPRGSPPVPLASDAILTDIDSVTLKGGRLKVTPEAGANSKDRLRILRTGGIKISGKNVLFNGNKIGRLTATRNSITVDFTTDSATTLAVQQLLRSLSFSTTSKFAGIGARSYTITVTDGAGGQVTTTQTVSVTDRAPS